mmetsp:Transcript_31380/g.47991  ORF Transcript_31380/g.47991 Transcript_31380/m.47991 type:complete len:143 (+) Transcript_31380:606-1034(+)
MPMTTRAGDDTDRRSYMSPTKSSQTKRVSDLESCCILDVVKEELVASHRKPSAQFHSNGFRRFSLKNENANRFGSRVSLGSVDQEKKKKSKLKKFLTNQQSSMTQGSPSPTKRKSVVKTRNYARPTTSSSKKTIFGQETRGQ